METCNDCGAPTRNGYYCAEEPPDPKASVGRYGRTDFVVASADFASTVAFVALAKAVAMATDELRYGERSRVLVHRRNGNMDTIWTCTSDGEGSCTVRRGAA